MSVSRRSSSRSLSIRRPILSISKASVAPTLSLVVAEFEPGRRRKASSASDSLKEMWSKEKESVAEQSQSVAGKSASDTNAEGNVASSPEPVQELSPDATPKPRPVTPAIATAKSSSQDVALATSPEPIPAPSTASEQTVGASRDIGEDPTSTISFPSTSPPSRSWFGSLGRVRGKDKARVYVESTLKESTTLPDDPITEQEQSAPLLKDSPVSESTVTPILPQSSAPQLIPSVQSSPPQTATSIPSSIDEHVPSLPSTPPNGPPLEQRQRVTSSPSRDLNSLNPSTSRFSLSIPLLGRPKVPLDVAMVKSAPASISETPGQTQTEETVKEGKEETTPTPQQTTAVSNQVELEGPSGHVASSSSLTYSWWSYVGWTPAPPSDSVQEPVQPKSDEAKSEKTVKDVAGDAVPASPSTPAPARPTPTPQIPVTAPEPIAESSTNQETPASRSQTAERPQSILSSETTSRASWYAPWSWYYSPTTISIAEQPEEEQAATDGMTPSERVREEALARSDPVIESVESTASAAIIESTTSNRSTWTSFFTSVNRKAIELNSVKRDEHGNEIMDIDEEEDTATVSFPSLPQKPVQPTPSRNEGSTTPKKPQPKKSAPQLVISEDVKKEASTSKRKVSSPSSSPAPKDRKNEKKPIPPPPPLVPNLVLPTWDDTFKSPPRIQETPPPSASRLLRFITGKGKSREDDLPFLLEGTEYGWAKSCKRVVVIGIHGWFPGAIMRSMLGEPTGTSPKFVAMMEQALAVFEKEHGIKFEKVTGMPLEGEGTIGGRVQKLYKALTENESWMNDLHDADAILIATHSQGSVVSTHLLNRLIEEGHVVTALAARAMPDELVGVRKVQRVCCLALCGIHLGPLRYLSTSSLLQPYFQYIETQAARELFEFQSTDSDVSKAYVAALKNVAAHGTKMVYVASMNDQVVPIYSGVFASANHPLILRALYIDGDAYHSSDFLSNLLVLLIRILNSGVSDSGLISLLSEATAGSLSGIGHSTAYEELSTYSLAVNYLFKTTPGPLNAELHVGEFDAAQEQNDYEIPWALRDLIAEERVRQLVGPEIATLRSVFGQWKPRTAVLRDVKKKLGPIQRLGNITEGRKSPSKL